MISAREFVIDDYDKAVALWNLVEGVEVAEGDSKEEIRAYLLRNPGLSRVAEESGKIVPRSQVLPLGSSQAELPNELFQLK
jgi:N-acetylglutamate synthase